QESHHVAQKMTITGWPSRPCSVPCWPVAKSSYSKSVEALYCAAICLLTSASCFFTKPGSSCQAARGASFAAGVLLAAGGTETGGATACCCAPDATLAGLLAAE